MSDVPLEDADLVTSTSTADAPVQRCPECRSEDAYMVIGAYPATAAEFPIVYMHCESCGHRWDAE